MLSHLTSTSLCNRSQFDNLQFIIEQLISNRLYNLESEVRISHSDKSNFILLYDFSVCHRMDEPILSGS